MGCGKTGRNARENPAKWVEKPGKTRRGWGTLSFVLLGISWVRLLKMYFWGCGRVVWPDFGQARVGWSAARVRSGFCMVISDFSGAWGWCRLGMAGWVDQL